MMGVKFECPVIGCTDTAPHGHIYQPKVTDTFRAIADSVARGKEDFQGKIDGAGYKKSMDDKASKPELTQVPPTFIEGVARVLMFGAQKYSRGNWMRGMSWSSNLDAMKRHIAAIEMGEDLDPDSGLPHIDHLACGAAFFSWYQNGPRKDEYKQFDDRIYKGEKK
jgi:hypothetical protein